MRIVVVAPNTTVLPPERDGGTERIVYELSEGIVREGHEVFLYARGSSSSSGTVISYPFDFFGEEEVGSFVKHTLPPKVDIIHDHTFSSTMSNQGLDHPIVSTRHIPRKTNAVNPVYVSQNALDTIGEGQGIYIHNGLQPEDYQFSATKKSYLLFMGRIVPDKGVDQAINIAEWTNSKLIIAGPKHDAKYFNKEIAPRLKRNPKLVYVDSVGGQERQNLLKNARCLLFPIQWKEPFGLVMIEALVCGTPVLALNKGAVKEVLRGFPEFICKTPKEMANKLKYTIHKYSPQQLRKYVLDNFDSRIMTHRYIDYYKQVIKESHHQLDEVEILF